MLIHEAAQITLVEVPRVAKTLAEKRFFDAFPEGAAKPARQGNGKPHLRPVQDVARQTGFHRLLEQPLSLAPLYLHR